MKTIKTSECDYDLVVARRDAFLTANIAKISTSASTSPTPPSARLGRDRLRDAVSAKGLTAALDNLPPLTAVEVSPQVRFPSEHAYKVRIGFLHDCPVWAALGECKSAVEHGPTIVFYTGHTDNSLISGGLFHNLGRITMAEPFATFWQRTEARFENIKDAGKLRGRWDERRGQFKSLVYWYFVNEAAERGGECLVPNTVSKYLVSTLKVLGTAVMGRTGNMGITEGVTVKDVFAAQSRLVDCEKERRELEEARDEKERREMEESRRAVEAETRQEEDQVFSTPGGRSRDIGDTNKLTARVGKIDSTEGDCTATNYSLKRRRTIDSTDIVSDNNTSATEVNSPRSKNYKTACYCPFLHADACNPEDDTATETKANPHLFPSISIQAPNQNHISAFKLAITRHEELEEREKSLQDEADELKKRSAEVQQQIAAVKKLKEDNLWVIKDLAIEW